MPSRNVDLDDSQIGLIAKALGDPNRLEMLRKIGESKEAPTCSCLRDWLGIAPATVSHHLKELENAGLIQLDRNGKFAYVTVRRDVLKAYARHLAAI